MDALDSVAARRSAVAGRIGDSQHLRTCLSAGQSLARNRRAGVRHQCLRESRRDRDHGAETAPEFVELDHHLCGRAHRKCLANQSIRRDWRRLRHSAAIRAAGNPALPRVTDGLSLAQPVGRRRASVARRGYRRGPSNCVPISDRWTDRPGHRCTRISVTLRWRLAALSASDGDRTNMKRIFITGASAGIGLATAKLLAERGDEVWGTSRDIGRLPSLPHFHPVRLELSDNVSLGESFEAALHEAGHFDVVINNAGDIAYFGPMESLSPETLRAQFQTLVFAHIELYRLALAAMRSRGSGRVINVTSLAAR